MSGNVLTHQLAWGGAQAPRRPGPGGNYVHGPGVQVDAAVKWVLGSITYSLRSPPCSRHGFPALSRPRWSAGEGASISIKALHLTASSRASCAPAFGGTGGAPAFGSAPGQAGTVVKGANCQTVKVRPTTLAPRQAGVSVTVSTKR